MNTFLWRILPKMKRKKKKKVNLIKAIKLKEVKYWKRTWNMHHKFSKFMKFFPLGFPLAFTVVTIFHYLFTFAHFLLECYLWLFKRKLFKTNMIRIQKECLV